MREDVVLQIMVIFTDLTTLETLGTSLVIVTLHSSPGYNKTLSSFCAIGVPAVCLLPDVSVEIPHRGELVAAVVTRRVTGVVLFVTAQGLVVMEHFGADITNIVTILVIIILMIAVAIVLIYPCKLSAPAPSRPRLGLVKKRKVVYVHPKK